MQTAFHNPNWPLRLALVLIAGGLAAITAMLFSAATSIETDPEQREVMHVVQEPAMRRFAVVYRHYDAGGAAPLDGLWIEGGSAPPVGAHAKPEGGSIAVWRGLTPAVSWKDGRVVIAADVAPENVLAAGDPTADCLGSGSAGIRPLQLCIDRTRVTFVRIRL